MTAARRHSKLKCQEISRYDFSIYNFFLAFSVVLQLSVLYSVVLVFFLILISDFILFFLLLSDLKLSFLPTIFFCCNFIINKKTKKKNLSRCWDTFSVFFLLHLFSKIERISSNSACYILLSLVHFHSSKIHCVDILVKPCFIFSSKKELVLESERLLWIFFFL